MSNMIEELKKILKRLGPLGFFIIPILGVIVFLFIILILFQGLGGETAISPFDSLDKITETSTELPSIYIGEERVQIRVEVADSQEEWEIGLMGRTNLPEKQGMLFVFPDENVRSFWMKNTYIPLDIIFINSNGEIVNFFESVEPLNETKTYESDGGVKYVLELNGGSVKKFGVEVGKKINFEEI